MLQRVVLSPQLFLSFFAFGDIACHVYAADHRSEIVDQGGRGDQEIAVEPVFVDFTGVRLAVGLRQDVGAAIRRRASTVDRFEAGQAHALLGGHAEAFGHGAVDARDPKVLVEHGD